jgi:hypothetical protein
LGCVGQEIACGLKKNESMNPWFPQEKRQNTADMNGKADQGFTAGGVDRVRAGSWQ